MSEEEIDHKKGKILFSWMPHSIMCMPAHFLRSNPKLPIYNSLLMGSRMAVDFPIFGSVAKSYGLSGANPSNFK